MSGRLHKNKTAAKNITEGNTDETKRSYGHPFFGMRRRNNGRTLTGKGGGKPIKNYEFYDDKNEFGWYKDQGNKKYPYNNWLPHYSNDGYEEYQKAPDVSAVAHAMATLEKHMSSSEALHTDNMFRHDSKEHGDHHQGFLFRGNEEHGEPNVGPNGGSTYNGETSHEGGSYHEGGRPHHVESSHEGNYASEGGRFHEGGRFNDGGGPNTGETYNENVGSHRDGDSRETGHESREESENNRQMDDDHYHNNERAGMTENYGWKTIDGPSLLNHQKQKSHENSEGSEKSQQNEGSQENGNESGREGWLPLTPPNHKRLESHEPDVGQKSEAATNHEGRSSESNPPTLTQQNMIHHEDDRGVFNGATTNKDGVINDEQKALYGNGYQENRGNTENHGNGKNLEANRNDYVDFPSTNTNHNDEDSRNRGSFIEGTSSKQENPREMRKESTDGKANEQGSLTGENTIKINVGYPHYHVADRHIAAALKVPHAGPERGGGLWGSQPGEGEQYQEEKKEKPFGQNQVQNRNENGMQHSDTLPKPNSTSLVAGNYAVKCNGDTGCQPANETAQSDSRGVQRNGSEEMTKVTRIPVTVTTGVYDSRELVSVEEQTFVKNTGNKEKVNRDFTKRGGWNNAYEHKNYKTRPRKKGEDDKDHKVPKFRRKLRHLMKIFKIQKTKYGRNHMVRGQRLLRGKESQPHSLRNVKKFGNNAKFREVYEGKKEKERKGNIGRDLGSVHGHPAVSDEKALHSNPEELLEMANGYRHRAEEYDSKAKELENMAEVQDHQHDHHGAVSQHNMGREGPERGGGLHGDDHGEGEQYHHQQGIGPWSGPTWFGPGPFGMSHFQHGGREGGHGSQEGGNGGMDGEHGGHGNLGGHVEWNGGHEGRHEDGHGGGGEGGHGGAHEEGGDGGHGEGHDNNIIHFNTGYPFYHVPRPHSLPQIQYHKPEPPVHGLNPYEVLTSEQFHRPMLPAGHGNLPYGSNQRTLHSRETISQLNSNRNNEEIAGAKMRRYSSLMRDFLTDENVASFLLK